MSWEEALPRFSLTRRVSVLVIMVTGMVVGAIATVGIPLELVPAGFDAPHLTVNAPWRDAPAKEVLDKVVLPLEEELSTVRGLQDLNSYSRVGQGEIYLTFKTGTDMDVAYREVRDRILRTRPRLPNDLEPVKIRKESGASLPIAWVGIAISDQVTDPYNLIQREIVTPLSRVDGVASVQSPGLQQKEVLIELDRDKTGSAGLNIYLVAQQLAADNFTLASGTVRYGSDKLLLRSVAQYDDLDALREQLVSPTVRLSDIGTVRYAVPDRYFRVRVNSKPAMALQIYKEGQANTIEVGKRINAAFEEIRDNPKLQGSDVAMLFNQTDVIEESLSTLFDSGKVGAIFAALVLLFFLRRFRLTLIITLSIPLSMVIALTTMYFAGETLNVLSLLGLIISVGLLVDNSVVVAENIHRLHRGGMSRKDACIKGAAEIALAITLATLTTIIVFLPVSLVEGQAQFFLLRLAIPITVSLAASLMVALVFIPLCVYLTLRRPTGPGEMPAVRAVHGTMDRVLGGAYNLTLEPVRKAYAKVLAVCLRRRLELVLGLFVVFGITQKVAMESIDLVPVSSEDRRNLEVEVELPSNFGLEDAEAYFRTVETALESVKEELTLEGYFIAHGPTWGRVNAWFPDQETLSRREVTDRVMEVLPKPPGVKLFAGAEDRAGEDQNQSLYTVMLNGEDAEQLADVAKALEKVLVASDGVLGAKRSGDMAPNELALVVNRDRTERQGINPQAIAGVVAYGLRGVPLPKLHSDGTEIPVRLRFQEEDRENLEALADYAVPNAAGEFVRLSSITDVSYLTTARGIFRQNKRISYAVTVELQEGVERETRTELDRLVASFDLPEGVRFGAQASKTRLDEDFGAMKFAAVLSILFIYLLMGFLFESFVLPMSIILTIPLASIGALWSHYFAQRDLDFLGFVGVILLIGVVVNNGIVFVDYVNRLRMTGVERTEALLLSAHRRFRPIMMTAGTTICGMIPLTLGAPTSIGLSYKSFGLTLIGGMATATALTMLVVPVFYTLLEDARDALVRSMRAGLGR